MIIKNDADMGNTIKSLLISKNIEKNRCFNISDDNQDKISEAFSSILDLLGLTTSEFAETPYRVAKLFCRELFWGLDYNNFPACSLIKNEFDYNSIISQKNINIMSFCEHHFLPFEGRAEIKYIPKNNLIIGLSNLDKIANFFSRRPQIQERLTAQIFETLKFLLKTEDISIRILAKHSCVSLRGENTKNTETETIVTGGVFFKA